MAELDPDAMTRQLAAESLADNDPTGWFERLYVSAGNGAATVPWDYQQPQGLLADWAEGLRGDGQRALVVGCGFGRDAEFVAGLGFDTDAFDFSESAIAAARQRHAGSPVRYRTADLLHPPAEWRAAFDLVVECLTVQSLPPYLHGAAAAEVARFVAPGGTLIMVASMDDGGPVDGPPWPLTRSEIDAFGSELEPVQVEELTSTWSREVPTWRAEFRRPAR
jgi:SAM-dependent methyltransferase